MMIFKFNKSNFYNNQIFINQAIIISFFLFFLFGVSNGFVLQIERSLHAVAEPGVIDGFIPPVHLIRGHWVLELDLGRGLLLLGVRVEPFVFFQFLAVFVLDLTESVQWVFLVKIKIREFQRPCCCPRFPRFSYKQRGNWCFFRTWVLVFVYLLWFSLTKFAVLSA